MVALNRNFDEPVARSLIYQKVYVGFVVDDLLLFKFHLAIKIALRLEVVPQIAGALHQQVAVHRMLFKDRDEAAQRAPGDRGAEDIYRMRGPASIRMVVMARLVSTS